MLLNLQKIRMLLSLKLNFLVQLTGEMILQSSLKSKIKVNVDPVGLLQQLQQLKEGMLGKTLIGN
jgi:hypothetical protein